MPSGRHATHTVETARILQGRREQRLLREHREFAIPQGQVGGPSQGQLGAGVPPPPARHSVLRGNKNERGGFKGQSQGWEKKTVPPLVTGWLFLTSVRV